jgi:dipeptidase E
MKKILLASTSTVYGKPYLSYLFDTLKQHFAGVSEVLFIPYARPSGMTHDQYTETAAKAFAEIGIKIRGIHAFQDRVKAIREAQGFFTGGGNSFVLLNDLYKDNQIKVLREEVLKGKPYFGTSAGSNIAGPTIMNTNDMPIVYPPTFEAMGLIPFNINPHYLDPVEGSTHMGETRETRIDEYLVFNDIPVIGLREGSWLEIEGDSVVLKGRHTARWFEREKKPQELSTGTKIR